MAILPNRATALVLFLVSVFILSTDANAQDTNEESAIVRVFFGGKAPKGWSKFKKSRISKGVKTTKSKDNSLAEEFRGFVSKQKTFSYTQSVKPGTYDVVLGFAEIEKKNCKKNKRVFQVQVNNKNTGPVDVFKSVKCNTAYTVVLSDVVVGSNKKLIITLTKVKGASPFISNFQVLSGDGTSGSPTPTPTPSGKLVVVKDIDVGGLSDEPGSVKGSSQVFPNVVPTSGTTEVEKFSKHRFSMDFTYVFEVQKKVTYSVELSFSESFVGACGKGLRVFDVSAYDGGKSPNSGKSLKALDIFDIAGCRTAYTTEIKDIAVAGSGKLAIRFMSVVENAMVSAIKITTNDPKYVPTPTPVPEAFPFSGKELVIDAGKPGDAPQPVPGSGKFLQAKPVTPSAGATEVQLQRARTGSDFMYVIGAPSGKYDVQLSFAELFDPNFCGGPGSRIFDVYINGKRVLEKLDIFAEAGCLAGVDFDFIAKVKNGPLTIRFVSIKSFAVINYIKIIKK